MSTPCSSCSGDNSDGGAIVPFLPLLDAEDFEVINPSRSLVRCPGLAFHSSPSKDTDCRLYVNRVGSTPVPCLYCFHDSCRALIQKINARWYRAALEGLLGDGRKFIPKRKPHIDTGCSVIRPSAPPVEEVLAQYPWTYQDIINDPRGVVDHPPELQYVCILSLYDNDDPVWIANDVKESGAPWHSRNFRTVQEWIEEGSCPGVFICPNTFNPGVCSRSHANVAKRKFLVVESDELNRNEVGAVFRWLEEVKGLTLRAVVDTAGKSLHGWFNYPDPKTIPALKQQLVALKCDPSMFQPSQPCRLPGALRNGKYQTLIHFRY